jgi:hypothetical protein
MRQLFTAFYSEKVKKKGCDLNSYTRFANRRNEKRRLVLKGCSVSAICAPAHAAGSGVKHLRIGVCWQGPEPG